MASSKQLIEWVKAKILDDTISLSERADFELFWNLMQRRRDLKAAENRQLKKLSEQLESAYAAEADDMTKDSKSWLVSTGMLCALFSRTRKSIADWVKMGMPQEARGQFDFTKVLPWWLETLYHAPEDKDESITEWRRRERAAKAQQAELMLQNMRGEFIKKHEHESVMIELCSDLRNTMLSWPSRVFPNDDDSRAKLREEVFMLLDRFVENRSFKIEPEKPAAKPKKKAAKKKVKGGKK